MSFPPTVITTDTHKHKHEQEQDTCSHHGVGSPCGAHAAAMPRTGSGHVAELCQNRDDARRGRDGLPAGRTVLQRAGLADSLRRDSHLQWRHGKHPDDIRRLGKGAPQVCSCAWQRS